MYAKALAFWVMVVAAGCSAPGAHGELVTGTAPAARGPSPPPGAAAPIPIATLAEADRAYAEQLGATRGGRFDTERQLMVLKQAVLLYTQFLEKADGRPELEPAVRKSRERIEDARDTIVFLEAALKSDQEPSAPTR